MKFSEMKDEELIEEATGLHDAIYVSECYGTKDLMAYDVILAELDKRGYTWHETIHFAKVVDDKEEAGDSPEEVHW